MRKDQYIVAIEIGSSKIVGAVATKSATNAVSVVAVEEEKVVDCVRYGNIQNVEETYTRVSRILRKLENRQHVSPRKIKSIYVGVGGRSVRAIRQEAEMTLSDNTTITDEHIRHLMKDIRREQFEGFEILGVVPYQFKVNGIEVKKAVGTIGSHLSGEFNIIVGRPLLKTNLKRVLEERIPLQVHEYCITPLEVAKEVLTTKERQLGCMLVDFGAETTTVSIYKNDVLQYLATIPIGSRVITRDLTTLNILEDRAEDMKKSVGNAIIEDTTSEATMDGIPVNNLLNFITARAGEIKENIISQLEYAGLTINDIPGGIILVGGGAKLKNFDTLIANSTKLPVRKGTTDLSINILDPRAQALEYIQIISLLDCAASHIRPEVSCCEAPVVAPKATTQQANVQEPKAEQERSKEPKKPGMFGKIIKNLKDKATTIFEDEDEEEEDE